MDYTSNLAIETLFGDSDKRAKEGLKEKNNVIAFEGLDGSGKDTLIENFAKYLESKGKKVKVYHSLKDTGISKFVRDNLDNKEIKGMLRTNLFLAELGLLDLQIKADIASNEYDYILVNRWLYSTYAYLENGDYDSATVISLAIEKYTEPTYVMFVDASLRTVLTRLAERGEDTINTNLREKLQIVHDRYCNIFTGRIFGSNSYPFMFVNSESTPADTLSYVIRSLYRFQEDTDRLEKLISSKPVKTKAKS